MFYRFVKSVIGFALSLFYRVQVTRAVEDARAAGKKIIPLCPFAAAQFRRHPEWADVLKS